MRRVVVTLTVLVVCAVGLGWTGPPATAAAEPPLPDGLDLRFADEVDALTRWHVTRGLEVAWAYFRPLLADADEFAAVVVVVTNVDDAAEAWAAERGISRARARRLFTARSGSYAGLATTGLTVIINDNRGDAGATVHEFVHLIQRHMAGGSSGPAWISEGAAEYFTAEIEAGWGIDAEARPAATEAAQLAEEWAATITNCRAALLPAGSETCRSAEQSLQRLEATRFDLGGGAVSHYSRATVSFQALIDGSSSSAYLCFLAAQGDGAEWSTAFTDCFHQTIDEFYDDFERLRNRGFAAPPARRWSPL